MCEYYDAMSASDRSRSESKRRWTRVSRFRITSTSDGWRIEKFLLRWQFHVPLRKLYNDRKDALSVISKKSQSKIVGYYRYT